MSYGFVSNSVTFVMFTDNVLHEKIKFGKILDVFKIKTEELADFYPFLPHYGFIGDHTKNHLVAHEFACAKVPHSSVIDTFTNKALLSMYGITGNACSIDSTLFFLSLVVSNYLLGFYQQIIRFCLNKNINIFKRSVQKKIYMFKRLKNIKKYSEPLSSYYVS